jgi:SHS2 domain-containing protein
MPFRFLEDVATADIAFEAWGKDLEETFTSAADAVMNVMVEGLDSILPRERRQIKLGNEALDMLLFDFLQELIYFKDSQKLLLRVEKIKIDEKESLYRLEAAARGEELDPNRHDLRVDVKAVTLHNFRLEKTGPGWKASVILDI